MEDTFTPLREGYYYKPHHKIQLKNYSAVISDGELPQLIDCENCTSGLTFGNEIVLLSGQTDTNIRSLILKLKTIEGLTNFQNIRITETGDTNSYITPTINLSYVLKNSIIIPYIKDFFGSLTGLTMDNYIMRSIPDASIPIYCQDMGDGTCRWREILKEGNFDEESTLTEEFTFTNGVLYVNKPINLQLKRQDPFGDYGLLTSTFPYDLYGKTTKDIILNNIIAKQNETC
jgi:hypothetical protein